MIVAGPARRDLRVTTVTTAAPSPFDFAGTAYSHGWAVLAPNCWDGEGLRLARTERLGPGRVVHLDVTGAQAGSGERETIADRCAILVSSCHQLRLR